MEQPTSRISQWLKNAPTVMFMSYAVVAAFTTYFCMYGFRKAFAVASYENQPDVFGGMEIKAALIISQLIGYASSKYIGVKFLSELHPHRRARVLVLSILAAEGALFLFGVLPSYGKVVAIFFNGLPLGIVWGLVFSYLEGRKTSEVLGAGLSCSFIIASGFAKSVGAYLMEVGVPGIWMPAVAGLVFLPFFFLAVWMLNQIPPPNAEDVAERVKREPMTRQQRKEFFAQFFGGLCFLLTLYVVLTAYRDFRDNYMAEIWQELGRSGSPSIFTKTELPIAFFVMAVLALLYLIKDNRKGFLGTHLIMMTGTIMIGVSTLLFDLKIITDIPWMILVGLGLYLGYVPYGCVLFDRMIAATGIVATAVFAIYVADALGYTGVIGVVLYKQFSQTEMSYLQFFRYFSYFTSVFCTVSFIASMIYFRKNCVRQKAD